MAREISTYEQEAIDFLKAHKAKMTISHVSDEYGEWEISPMTRGWLYRVRIDREGKSWSFNFSDSYYDYKNGNRPSKYSVLACITKYEPGTLGNFIGDYGYTINDEASYNKVNGIYKAVCKEYANVMRMFGDCIEELAEIN